MNGIRNGFTSSLKTHIASLSKDIGRKKGRGLSLFNEKINPAPIFP